MKKLLVWDLPLRLFHWLFACTFFASWYTSDQENDLIELHMQLGYFMIALILFRVLWGFFGTTHSRFQHFTPSPAAIARYFKTFFNRNSTPSIGHNPIGSLMVFLMLFLMLLQAVSGLFINDDIFSSGPYYGVIDKSLEKVMFFIHHNFFDVMLVCVAFHIAAIFYYYFYKKQNLIKPMVSGYKLTQPNTDHKAIPHSKLLIALLLCIVVGIFIYWLVVLNVPEIEFYY